jgi:hypothetical protein
MNQLMLVVIAVVALCYFGGNYCPTVLRQNKEMVLGVSVGMALCSFMDLRMEGFDSPEECFAQCEGNNACTGYYSVADDCVGVANGPRDAQRFPAGAAAAARDAEVRRRRSQAMYPDMVQITPLHPVDPLPGK